MREIKGDLWKTTAAWTAITTNGFVKNTGEAVMGRGCAQQAKDRYPSLPRTLGQLIKKHGNTVFFLKPFRLIIFPVKHHWAQPADLSLIEESARRLAYRVGYKPWQTVILPRPGCGNGQLSWSEVKLVIAPILPDHVFIISFLDEK